jgi:hypothetical protein
MEQRGFHHAIFSIHFVSRAWNLEADSAITAEMFAGWAAGAAGESEHAGW